jgi:hypothetical protein
MKNLFNISLVLFCIVFHSSCSNNLIKGTWQYDGGVYNGRSQKASVEFQMNRIYTSDSYEAFMLEGNNPPELYNSGIYEIKGDSIFITSKFSSRPSQNTDVTIAYKFSVHQNKLTLYGILPNGMIVEEYWKRVN